MICVLGMHRSGTSFLVGSLQQHGLFLGRHHTSNKFNLRGNRENQDIWDLQDDILEQSGGSWDEPPASVKWMPEHFERAREILAEYAAHPIWGFKDPRTLLTLEGWRALIPDLELVGIFRHPLPVASSLHRRDQMPAERAFDLWRLYNRKLLEVHRSDPFPVLCFDDAPDLLARRLLEVVDRLDLERGEPGEPFFAAELRQAAASGSAPPELERLYAELRSLTAA